MLCDAPALRERLGDAGCILPFPFDLVAKATELPLHRDQFTSGPKADYFLMGFNEFHQVIVKSAQPPFDLFALDLGHEVAKASRGIQLPFASHFLLILPIDE